MYYLTKEKNYLKEEKAVRIRQNDCSTADITPSPLVTVLLSELVCGTRVISPNDHGHLPHLKTSECG